MKLAFGIALALLELIMVIAGITCLAIVPSLDVSPIRTSLLVFGIIGVSSGVGTVLTIVSSSLILSNLQ